ncbi:MAG: phosphoribosylamine--glycine ligase [archaeon]
MKILVVGSGGREHALVWKIAQSKLVKKIYCAPGNAGTLQLAENLDIGSEDIKKLADFASDKKIDLTIVGPEAPLVEGIVDEFNKKGLVCFGPTKKGAQLEGSKAFTRALCKKYDIPGPAFEEFDDYDEALDYVDSIKGPLVVKADGLAAGKGVIIADTKEHAHAAIKQCLVDNEFGKAGNKIVIEEKLIGEEVSYLVLCDGQNFLAFPSAQDHKRVFDNDSGPNTGGMGAYSPAPVFTEKVRQKVDAEIIQKTIDALIAEGIEYKGVLYAGLMINNGDPKLLEYNCRFGDPETQAIVPRVNSDLVELFQATINGNLNKTKIDISPNACTAVVLASGGYPGNYEKGIPISGLDLAAKVPNTQVFHAGTKKQGNAVVTNGGRVLSVTALGADIEQSIKRAYVAVEKVRFEKMMYRTDIGKKAIDLIKLQKQKKEKEAKK